MTLSPATRADDPTETCAVPVWELVPMLDRLEQAGVLERGTGAAA